MFEEIQEKLQQILEKKRYEHTIGVMYTAGCLAMAHGFSMEKSMLAGLLHDCAKCMSHEEHVALCNLHQVPISEAEHQNKSLLHAKAGAILAEDEYGITDPEILHAIAVHTTGQPDMSVLDKIIYIADYIEPSRDKAMHLEQIRALAYQDLDACMAQILYDTLKYLETKSHHIDDTTQETYLFYEKYRREL